MGAVPAELGTTVSFGLEAGRQGEKKGGKDEFIYLFIYFIYLCILEHLIKLIRS